MKYIVYIVLCVVLLLYIYGNYEAYSQATITQLMAKGPQDAYLSADAIKYIPPYYGYGRYWPWSMPTRLGEYGYGSISRIQV